MVGDFGPTEGIETKSFGLMRASNHKGSSPNFVSEYYTGWLTHWRMDNTFQTKKTDDIVRTLKKLPNFVFYMAYGGTNFGFTNG